MWDLTFIPLVQYTFLTSNKMYIPIDYIFGASLLGVHISNKI